MNIARRTKEKHAGTFRSSEVISKTTKSTLQTPSSHIPQIAIARHEDAKTHFMRCKNKFNTHYGLFLWLSQRELWCVGCNVRPNSTLISRGCFWCTKSDCQWRGSTTNIATTHTQKDTTLVSHKYVSLHAPASMCTLLGHVHVRSWNTRATFQGSDERLKVFELPKNLWCIYGRHPESAFDNKGWMLFSMWWF